MKRAHDAVIKVPLSIPERAHAAYRNNFDLVTKGTGSLFLFAGDQKLEHLNKDFFGTNIDPEAANPTHLFNIAQKASIGVFATQLGMIARYAGDFSRSIPYLVKVNSKTDLVGAHEQDPYSATLCSMDDILRVKKNGKLNIVGVGYTVYLGSSQEAQMLHEAAKLILQAHQEGLLAVLWMYPRGKAVPNERSVDVIAGAAGVATCLGADFVKVNPPLTPDGKPEASLLQQATRAAGNTGVICSGGASKEPAKFLQELRDQVTQGGVRGAAIGRNIHQKSLEMAVAFCDDIASIIYGNSIQK